MGRRRPRQRGVADKMIESLLASWEKHARMGVIDFDTPNGDDDLVRAAAAYGLAAHTHQLARAVTRMARTGHLMESVALVRLAYECGLTAMWMAKHPQAAHAFTYEGLRLDGLTYDVALGTGHLNKTDERPESDPELAHLVDREVLGQAKYFEQRCRELAPDAPELYLHYRLLCRLGHATPHVVGRYLVADPQGQLAAVRADPEPVDYDELWVLYLAHALVWAGLAVDRFDREHNRRRDLLPDAEALDLPEVVYRL